MKFTKNLKFLKNQILKKNENNIKKTLSLLFYKKLNFGNIKIC